MALPIRPRLALVCAGLVAVIVVAVGALVYVRLEADLLRAVDDELQARTGVLVADGDAASLAVSPTDVGDIFAQRLRDDGALIATSPGLLGPVIAGPDVATLKGERFVEATIPTADDPVFARLLATRTPDGSIVIVGVTIDDQRAALTTLLLEFALALPLGVVLAAVVGWLVAGAALRPVERIRVEAEAISGSEPERRLPVPETGDELAALGTSLNRMLDRLQTAVERERRFVDDASHELRTPLANLKAELDLALRRSRTGPELVAALRSAADETDRLTRLAEDLLVLARAADGRLPIRLEEVDMTQLVRDTVESFGGRAANLEVTLTTAFSGDARATVDPARIRQALANLIDNSLRHTPHGGRIAISVDGAPGQISITVGDSGEGFPASFLPFAFDPFRRADAARTRGGGGAGLGLAIVLAVAEAHRGTVEARQGPDSGAEVVIRLPA